MPSEWRRSKWGDEISLEYGKGIRGYQDARGAYRVYGANGPVGWTSTPLAPGPGVILGRKGAYRGVEYSKEPFFVIDTAYYVKLKTDLNMRWVYYAIKYHRLGEIDDGSPIPSTTRSAVYVRDLRVPTPNVQNRSAEVLGRLDDRIDLNRLMNRTLERMAQALFKSWFIDFDPVRAKSDGRDPGLPTEIAALFASRFIDSELGPIPEGWDVIDLPEAIEVNPSRTLKKGTLAAYVEMANMPTRSSRVLGWEMREFTSGSKFLNGDVLVARITPCLENGKTAYVDFLDGPGVVGWGSTEYIVLRSKPPLPTLYAYCLARSDRFRSHAIANMSGTSGRQRVPPSCLDAFPVVVPSQPVAEVFGRYVDEWMHRIKKNEEQARTLAGLRDVLLPKLLSGEIELPVVEAMAPEAMP